MREQQKADEFARDNGVDFYVSADMHEELMREELPEQMLLYDWKGAVTNEIKQNA